MILRIEPQSFQVFWLANGNRELGLFTNYSQLPFFIVDVEDETVRYSSKLVGSAIFCEALEWLCSGEAITNVQQDALEILKKRLVEVVV